MVICVIIYIYIYIWVPFALLRIVLTPLREFNRTSAQGFTRCNYRTEKKSIAKNIRCFYRARMHHHHGAPRRRCLCRRRERDRNKQWETRPGNVPRISIARDLDPSDTAYCTNVRRTHPNRTDFAQSGYTRVFCLGQTARDFRTSRERIRESGTVKNRDNNTSATHAMTIEILYVTTYDNRVTQVCVLKIKKKPTNILEVRLTLNQWNRALARIFYERKYEHVTFTCVYTITVNEITHVLQTYRPAT